MGPVAILPFCFVLLRFPLALHCLWNQTTNLHVFYILNKYLYLELLHIWIMCCFLRSSKTPALTLPVSKDVYELS